MAVAAAEKILEQPAAPLITPPPSAEAVVHRLEARINGNTCGWSSANPEAAFTCPAGLLCYRDTVLSRFNCCSQSDFPTSCNTIPTKCYNSADVAASCDSDCLSNSYIVKCTYNDGHYCATPQMQYSDLSFDVWGYVCDTSSYQYLVYDYFTSNGVTVTTVPAAQLKGGSSIIISTDSADSSSITSNPPSSTILSSPFSSAASSDSSSASSSANTHSGKMSDGVIAGIVVGVILGIALLFAVLFGCRLLSKRQSHRQRMELAQAQPMLRPSTSQNAFATALPLREIHPHDSASQVNRADEDYHLVPNPQYELGHATSGAEANSSSPSGRSNLGEMPNFYDQNRGHYGQQGPQSVLSGPGSAFGSMPPTFAPDLAYMSSAPVTSGIVSQGHHQRQSPSSPL